MTSAPDTLHSHAPITCSATEVAGTRAPALRFTVRGVPGPQGSKDFKGFSRAGRAILTESSKLVKPWRQDVVAAAVSAIEQRPGWWRPIDGPVHVVIEFFLARPKSQPRTRRTLPTKTPDLDKLIRATGDALKTAGVYCDDSLVTDVTARKRYVVQDDALGHAWELPGSGAVISVFRVNADETWADTPLELSVSERFPVPVLPPEVVNAAGYTARLDASSVVGQSFLISTDAADTAATQVARKVLALVKARRAMSEEKQPAQVPVVLVVEDGTSRLASIPGKPYTPLQEAIAEIAETGGACQIDVLLAGEVVTRS